MDTPTELYSETSSPTFTQEQPKWITKRNAAVMFGVMAILLIGSVALSAYIYFSLSKNQIYLEAELNKTKQSLADVDARNKKDLANMQLLSDKTDFILFEHRLEGYVVTDDFVVDKAVFDYDDSKSQISATIDISTQPAMALKYKGQGSFDLQDRELKGKLQDILDQTQKAYLEYFKDTKYASVKNTTYVVTIKNYELGTYTNGQFKLKGE